MKKLTKTDRIVLIVLALVIAGAVLWFMRPGAGTTAPNADKKVTWSDYNGKKIGILTGTNMEAESFRLFPDSEYYYFDGYPNLIAALISGKIDAYLGDEPALRSTHAENPEVDYIRERITNNQYSFAFRKDDPEELALRDQFNEFLRKIKEDGTYAEIDALWFGTDEEKKVVDMSGLTGENGTLHVVTTSTDPPFSYIKDGQNVGYDIDVTVRFCREYGYALEIAEVDFNARIPALVSGRYEFTTTMNVTPEREESVLFSDPVSEGGIVVAVRAEDVAGTDTSDRLASYSGKVIGSVTGTTYDGAIAANVENPEIQYFYSYGDMVTALETGRIDAFCADEPVVRYMMITNDSVDYLPHYLEAYDFAFAFPKTAEGDKLREQFNEFVKEAKEDGTLGALDQKWFGRDEDLRTPPDMSLLTGENGKLKLATETLNPPFSYIVNGKPGGYEIDTAYTFCLRYGYSLEIVNYNFDALLPAIETGLCDFAGCCFTPTPERAESVSFSEPHYSAGAVLAVLRSSKTATVEKQGFFESIVTSFEKNFIRESRWKLILQGIGVTCLITALSALFGTLLAFLICLFRRTDSVLAGKISDIFVRLLQGTPTVVLLMILYYIVFARTSLSAILVAVIGFSLNFAAYASEIMRSGIGSIEGGQREAALALGYTERQTFFRFVFPQAAVHFLPVYRGEIVNMLKNTSIVGYIAIQDLTKMSDIIRSRTYEAFFPLFATAFIYFLLAWIITLLLKRLLTRIDPRKHGKKGKEAAEK